MGSNRDSCSGTRVELEADRRRAAGVAPQHVDRAVAHDAQQPGAHAASRAVEPRAAAPHRQERLLGDLLGHRAVAHDAVRERVGGAAVTVVDDLERRRVLALHERHQVLVGESLQGFYFHIRSLVGHCPDPPIYARSRLTGSA